jgi:hypothetical protein
VVIPAVMMIEMAIDQLKALDPAVIEEELKEFNSLGEGRTSDIVAHFEHCTDVEVGYLLGLECARIIEKMAAPGQTGKL